MEAPEVDVQAPEVDVQAPVAAEAPAADVQEPAAGAIAPLEGGDALVAPATEISGPPLTELVTNLGREQPFKKRQRAAHTLCKSLVHLDAPQVEVLRQLSPVAALLDLAVEAEALNDVLTLQLALSCLANLAVWLQDHGVGSSGILGRLLGRSIHRAHDMSTSESPPLPGEDFLIASPKRRASRAAAASLATYALAVCANLAADREFVAALMQAGPACASELEAMASRKGAYISFDASTAATASSVLRALQHMRASATHAEQKAAKATRKLAKTAAQSAKKVIVVRAAEERRAKKQRRLLEVATLAARRRAEAAIDTEYNQLRVEEALVRSQRAAKTTALETRLSRRLNNVVEVVPPPLVTRGEAKSDEIEARVKKLLMNSAGADEVLAAKQEYISEVRRARRLRSPALHPVSFSDGPSPRAKGMAEGDDRIQAETTKGYTPTNASTPEEFREHVAAKAIQKGFHRRRLAPSSTGCNVEEQPILSASAAVPRYVEARSSALAAAAAAREWHVRCHALRTQESEVCLATARATASEERRVGPHLYLDGAILRTVAPVADKEAAAHAALAALEEMEAQLRPLQEAYVAAVDELRWARAPHIYDPVVRAAAANASILPAAMNRWRKTLDGGATAEAAPSATIAEEGEEPVQPAGGGDVVGRRPRLFAAAFRGRTSKHRVLPAPHGEASMGSRANAEDSVEGGEIDENGENGGAGAGEVGDGEHEAHPARSPTKRGLMSRMRSGRSKAGNAPEAAHAPAEVDAEQRVAPAAAADGDAPAAVVEEEPLAVVDLLDEAEALDGGAPSQSNSGAATLVIREIVVFDVPNTDAVKEQGLPDPLLIFTLLETHGDAPAPTMRTKDVRNSLNPSWDGPYMLALPAGSSAATDRRPLVRIDMRDYDPENEDDPLCLLETRLTESTGRVERMMLPSVCGQPPSSISFAYEVVSGEVPAQADQAALILRNMQVIDVPDADENGSGSDPYLKFKLLEGPKRKHKPTARTKAQRNTIDPKWDGPLRLVFPDDAPAVTTGEPLVRIMLFDRDKGKDDELCAAEMRLTEKHGHVEKMTLPGVGGFAACTISFDFEIILRGDELPKE